MLKLHCVRGVRVLITENKLIKLSYSKHSITACSSTHVTRKSAIPPCSIHTLSRLIQVVL